jgi:hypothetical protein
MENKELYALANALLGCFLNRAGTDALVQICEQHGVITGEPEFCMAQDVVIDWLENREGMENLTPENHQLIMDKSIVTLISKYGAIPGKDFSHTGQGLLVSDALLEKIAADRPPGTFEQLKRMGQPITQKHLEHFYERE